MTRQKHIRSKLLSAYMDGELAPHETAAVEEHLSCCSSCREEFARLKRISGMLQALPAARINTDEAYRSLQTRIQQDTLSGLAARKTERKHRKAVHSSVHHWGKPVAAALAILILTAGIIFLATVPQGGSRLLMAGVVEQELDNSVVEQEVNDMIKGYDQLSEINYY